LRPDPRKLLPFFRFVAGGPLTYCRWLALEPDREDGMPSVTTRTSWKDWKTSFMQIALQVQQRLNETGISCEVGGSLLRALHYMTEHVDANLNQEAVARHVVMSRSYFSQCFKKFTGTAFAETLRQMRIRHAETLLLDTRLSIPEIAGRSGFEDDKYFSRVFRELTGRLPSEFRAHAALPGQGKGD